MDEQTLNGRIVTTLAKRIIIGEMPPGMPVRQDRVAEEFESSHVPVREAFRVLEAEGLLVASPRRGVRVAPLEPDSVLETSKMRAVLEALALEQAIPRLTTKDLETAKKANARCGNSQDISVWIEANKEFHMALMRPCAMPRLLAAVDELLRFSERYLYATWKNLNWQPRSDDEHAYILEALKEGKGAHAVEILKSHIVAAGSALATRLGAQY